MSTPPEKWQTHVVINALFYLKIHLKIWLILTVLVFTHGIKRCNQFLEPWPLSPLTFTILDQLYFSCLVRMCGYHG